MPFVANTPESLLNRSDSKNPTSTCRGITAGGRPCRRPLASGASNSLLSHSRRPSTPNPRDENLYCWQHKEQADLSARSSPGPRATATPILEGRSSIDTLADRLGLIELQEKSKRKAAQRPNQGSSSRKSGASKQPPRTRPKQSQKLEFCFCFSIPLEEVNEAPVPVRPQPRPVQQQSVPVPDSIRRSKQNQGNKASSAQHLSPARASPARRSYASRKSTASQTAQLKDLIPDTLDMATASALMAELARPYVDSEEAGFIYMFWLTPESEDSPPVAAAQSLLAPPVSPRASARSRRASDVVSSFADHSKGTGTKSMMLKIGRAANVQRRMNQWQRQCGYAIEMLRYYPYLPGQTDSSSGTVPRMTPHAQRVERLVHIELAGMGLRAKMDKCSACGRDHREWFEVAATRDGIRVVDDVIRRWIEWDEANV
ncbi:hypothetical protein HJFPF1_07718 [Paramyrothecium foliicola]|nr:hypothetical protein HJFPF1_07718 [Paramyrothecium foliicola]